MRRYAETFFRYWLIAIVPIIVLPLADYAMTRHTPKTVLTTANVWVDQSAAGANANYNQWQTPAQNEAATLNQLLQASNFEQAIIQASPLYLKVFARSSNPYDAATADLLKNLQVTSRPDWPNLVSVIYTGNDWQVGLQVVNSFLSTARSQTQQLNQQQATKGIAYYSYQLHSAQQSLTQSTKQLSDYLETHSISPGQMNAQLAVDPTLATLVQQNQANQAAVTSAQQQIAKLHSQQVPDSVAEQSQFQIIDGPHVSVVSSRKQQIMNIAIALVIGLLLGGGFLVVKTALDRSLRYTDEVTRLLDLPVLAVMPYNDTLAAHSLRAAKVSGKGFRLRRIAGARRAG